MGQRLHVFQAVDIRQCVIGAVDGLQGAALGPIRQSRYLIGGEVEALQLCQGFQGGNIGDGVAADAKLC